MPDVPAALSPSSQFQQGNTLPDVQHSVIMNKLWPIKQYSNGAKTVLKVYFWDDGCTKNKKDAVCTTIMKSARDKARDEHGPRGSDNPFDFETWEDHANIKFQIVEILKESDIRIIFTGKKFSSAVGTGAQYKDFAHHSMQLGPLKDRCPPTESDRGTILHEFGHALGLDHEHQGPAARQLLQLKKALVEKYYEEGTHGQVLEEVEDSELWNYTNFNITSIMVYRLDEEWQEQKTKYEIGWVNKLSDVDQASIKLMYPPDLTKPENHEPFKKALITAGVNETTAGQMIADFEGNSKGTVAARLGKLRDRFSKWKTLKGKLKENTEWLSFYNPNVDVLRYVDPASLKRSGINQFAGEVTKNKLFKSIMKIIVYRTMVQRGIPTNDSIPGATETEVTRLIAALSVHDKLGQLVKQHRVAFSGEDDNGDKVCNLASSHADHPSLSIFYTTRIDRDNYN
ncbi:hypothetical protein JVT61DRAFT_4853 [Boletus reticuloceps]|uniref:Peptidase metallopeptidase domain-containing protein n=1 Tax=Boletus reticuloceps TaxID=495285 RepID=A0A8I2YKD7_9AGAM|nr:hypothetical protein JVT61DRAFT_4853 [Boletus reticuloceps]